MVDDLGWASASVDVGDAVVGWLGLSEVIGCK